jgi:hypothetical protein
MSPTITHTASCQPARGRNPDRLTYGKNTVDDISEAQRKAYAEFDTGLQTDVESISDLWRTLHSYKYEPSDADIRQIRSGGNSGSVISYTPEQAAWQKNFPTLFDTHLAKYPELRSIVKRADPTSEDKINQTLYSGVSNVPFIGYISGTGSALAKSEEIWKTLSEETGNFTHGIVADDPSS